MSQPPKKARLLWADLCKIVAIFGVILLHVSAPYLTPFASSPSWWIGNAYDSFSRWCVPLFVMISGALILGGAGKRPLWEFLRVRVGRILVPFLVWSALYFAYRIQVKGDDLAAADFFRMILTEPIYYHLWFVYMLLVLYLFAPVAGAFLSRTAPRRAWYLVGLWFLWTSLLPMIDLPAGFSIYFAPGMDDYAPQRLAGYLLLGYMLRDWRAETGREVAALAVVFLMGGAGTMIGTYLMSRNAGAFDPFFYKYFSINVVVMAVSLFGLIKSLFHGRPAPAWAQRVGMAVFGVYLIHAMALEALRDGWLGFVIDHEHVFGYRLPVWGGIPLFAVAIFLVSLAPVLLLRRIPRLRDWVV